MSDLKPCPCGETPERLNVIGEHRRPKWARVSGTCCGTWEIEFRNSYAEIPGEESYANAAKVWNAAPRGLAAKVLRDRLEKYFLSQRFSTTNHLGLGDIRLTIGQQEEILKMVSQVLEMEDQPDDH